MFKFSLLGQTGGAFWDKSWHGKDLQKQTTIKTNTENRVTIQYRRLIVLHINKCVIVLWGQFVVIHVVIHVSL